MVTNDGCVDVTGAICIGTHFHSYGQEPDRKVYYHAEYGYTWGSYSTWVKPDFLQQIFHDSDLGVLINNHRRLINKLKDL